jgi:hypothetical protein
MTLMSIEWRGACAPPRIPNARPVRYGLVGGASRAEPSMVHGGFFGLKGGDGGPLLPPFITRTIPLCT